MLRSWYFIALLPTVVFAADRATQEAKTHFQAGQTKYKLGRFDEALADYSKAYELKPIPSFLFNIGQCHRQLHDLQCDTTRRQDCGDSPIRIYLKLRRCYRGDRHSDGP